MRALPPLLRAAQPARVRAQPGGHELPLPGRQDRGAAHPDPGHHQREPQVRLGRGGGVWGQAGGAVCLLLGLRGGPELNLGPRSLTSGAVLGGRVGGANLPSAGSGFQPLHTCSQLILLFMFLIFPFKGFSLLQVTLKVENVLKFFPLVSFFYMTESWYLKGVCGLFFFLIHWGSTELLLLLLCRFFNSGSAPLECDKDFWDLRDSVVQCELLILRQLNFYVSFEHPHKVSARESVLPEGRLHVRTSVPAVPPSLPDLSQVPGEPPRLVPDPRGRNVLGFAERLLPWDHVYPPYTPTHRHSNALPGTEHLRRRAACGGERVVAGVYI